MRRYLILLAVLAGCSSTSGDSAGGEPTIAEKLAVLDGDDAGVPTQYEPRWISSPADVTTTRTRNASSQA